MEFLDTNIILRYLTEADPAQPHLLRQAEQARAILQELEAGARVATTCEGVVVEVVQVLSSRALYNVPRLEIRRHLGPILQTPGLKIPHKRTYLRALDLYVENPFLDFVDALNVAHMERQHISTVLSFDRDFDRIPSVHRKEA